MGSRLEADLVVQRSGRQGTRWRPAHREIRQRLFYLHRLFLVPPVARWRPRRLSSLRQHGLAARREMMALVLLAPEVRRNKARSEAQRTPGNQSKMNAQPLTGATGKANQSEVPFIKGQTVRLQDDLELIKKRNVPMMFFLSLNVAVHLRYLRFTHRERAISFLPSESCGFLERSRNPTRRIRFHLTDGFRNCFVLPQFREDVNMVAGAV